MHTIKDVVKQLIGKSLDAYNKKYTSPINSRIDNIVAQAGNDNTEIVDARIDSAGVTHATLNNRILAETKMNDEQLVEYTGRDITVEDTTQGYLKDVEILGNTIQNEEDLADIKSVGVLQEDGTYKMSILSCGKNLINPNTFKKGRVSSTGVVDSIDWMYVVVNVSQFDFVTVSNIKWLNEGVLCRVLSNSESSFLGNVGIRTGFATLDVRGYDKLELSVKINSTVDDKYIQLEEGTVATPYEPYQENKCDILLPCQLEKVEDESDRLYYDDVEKAWCIEKNVVKIPLYESVNKINGDWETLYFSKTLSFDKVKNASSYCISSLLNYNGQDISTEDTITQLCIFRHANNFECRIRLRKDEFPNITTNEDYIKWATENDFYILLQSASPQKIVLPLSTQIQLNSFFGTTHVYMESGEVEGTIKCKIPKSIGATVQSLNNKTDILSDRIEAIEGLKDSQNMKYETDKGYLVCKETKNGVIDDLKIEGKTLVNLCVGKTDLFSSGKMDNTFTTDSSITKFIARCEPNKTYTIVKSKPTNRFIIKQTDKCEVGSMAYYLKGFEDNDTTTITTVKTKDTANFLWIYVNNSIIDCDVTILEGDHTQNPPSYFEGLMSVGQDVDKIEVLSRKEDGNLLDIKEVKGFFGSSPSYNEGIITGGYGIEIHPNNLFLTKGTYIFSFELDRKTDSVVDYYTIAFCGYNSENILGNIVINTLNNGICTKTIIIDRDINVKYIKFDCRSQRTNTTVSNICLSKTSNHTYTTHQSDKKQILFYNENGELEPIQELHEWDSIEKHSDNKWYYHKRSRKVVLNGSESWTFSPGHSDITTSLFYYRIDDRTPNSECICDKFTRINGHTVDYPEGVYYGADINIRISTSKLSSQDAEGFKQWLQENNVTVVYQLVEEKVYELAPLHLDSYANETLILCNSGVISPKMEFSITSHINELVKAYGERINLLEEKVYQYMVIQNRMQLASTYSADSVTFKVDYFSLCGDEENYDEDLYNLILNNILVGKDNYNYDKMFTMILDYASWNQISWEQFDILVGLMDMQHNPPVEEEITEDESIEETPVE